MAAEKHLKPTGTGTWRPGTRLAVLAVIEGETCELLDPGEHPIAELGMRLDRGRTATGAWQSNIRHGLRGWSLTLRSTTGAALAEARPSGILTHYNVSARGCAAELHRGRGNNPWRLRAGNEHLAEIHVGVDVMERTGLDGEVVIGPEMSLQADPLHLLLAALICVYADKRFRTPFPAGPPS